MNKHNVSDTHIRMRQAIGIQGTEFELSKADLGELYTFSVPSGYDAFKKSLDQVGAKYPTIAEFRSLTSELDDDGEEQESTAMKEREVENIRPAPHAPAPGVAYLPWSMTPVEIALGSGATGLLEAVKDVPEQFTNPTNAWHIWSMNVITQDWNLDATGAAAAPGIDAQLAMDNIKCLALSPAMRTAWAPKMAYLGSLWFAAPGWPFEEKT